jgi:SAM-dependent methyltransferase
MSATHLSAPSPAAGDADRQLKIKHRALWASGDYPAVASELISALGPRLVQACGIHAGQQVLDVAAGSGNAAIPAAATGATVTASDLTPELFDAGRAVAAGRGVQLDWIEADAEALPFADNTFDVVMSCVGAMFAPRHRVTADEMIRVVRPGGILGMINWTPEGFIGRLFEAMKPYAPPPAPGASPPPLWGDPDYVRELFGHNVAGLTTTRETVLFDHCASPQEFREYWKRNYGPTIMTYRFNADKPDRVAGLDRDLLALMQDWNSSTTVGRTEFHAEYLVVTATKEQGAQPL